MSRHSYTVTFDIEVSPDVFEKHIVEAAYKVQMALEEAIVALVPGKEFADVDCWNIGVERTK
jgi:hypothetical protein